MPEDTLLVIRAAGETTAVKLRGPGCVEGPGCGRVSPLHRGRVWVEDNFEFFHLTNDSNVC